MKEPQPNILFGMPSLLNQLEAFSQQWPVVKFLPPLASQSQKNLKCEEWLKQIPKLTIPASEVSQTQKQMKRCRIKKSKKISMCPHVERKHYAKLMCNVCYHSKARNGKATECEHKERQMYAKGMCLRCYQKTYKKQKRMQKNNSKVDEKSR